MSNRPRRPSSRPTAIDLFCGAGGMSLGLELAGIDVVLGVDNDPVHAAVHHYNFPHSRVVAGSVASFAGRDLLRHAGVDSVDIVVGGPPCQGFSLIGKRLVDDPRNQLLSHFGRLVREFEPRYFVMENVPGMLIGDHTSVLEALIDMLEEQGLYKCAAPVVVDAADYGVPQRRRRVILMGWRTDMDPVSVPPGTYSDLQAPTLLSHSGDLASSLPWVTVAEALYGIPDLRRIPELDKQPSIRLEGRYGSLFDQLEAVDPPAPAYARYLRAHDGLGFHRSRKWDRRELTNSQLTRHTTATIAQYDKLRQGETEPSHRLPRLSDTGQCPTLRAGSGRDHGAHTSPRPIHPTEPRVITVREAARLHSFPDWFRLHNTKWHGFRQIGNAVPPLLGKALADILVARLGGTAHADSVEEGDPSLLDMSVERAAAFLGAIADDVPIDVRAQRRRKTGSS